MIPDEDDDLTDEEIDRIVAADTEPPVAGNLPVLAPATQIPQADVRATYGSTLVWNVGPPPQRFALVPGTGRVLDLQDWVHKPLYIQFGDSLVVATALSTRMDNGRATYIIPDDATHVSLATMGDVRTIIAIFGLVEK